MFDVNNQNVIVAYRINPLINYSAGLYKTRVPHHIKADQIGPNLIKL